MSAQKSRISKSSFNAQETPVTSRKPNKAQGQGITKTLTPLSTSRFSTSTPAVKGRLSSVPSGRKNILTPVSYTEPSQTPTGSASQAQLIKENKALKEENEALSAELDYIKSLYKQLVEESHVEQFDDRRVNLLKSQVIQLERQVLLQSAALNARSSVLLELENQLSHFRDVLRELVSSVAPDEQDVRVPFDFLQALAGMTESSMKIIYKKSEGTCSEDLPLVYMGQFLKPSTTKDHVTLLDVCSGKHEHINLRHVSKLESKLSKLFKQLTVLGQSLQTLSPRLITSPHITRPVREKINSHTEKAVQMLNDCCTDLLSLAILVPSPHWPPLKKPIVNDITLEDTLSKMPALTKVKLKEVEGVLRSLFMVFRQEKHSLNLEVKILKEELLFHQSVYELQVDYTESLLSAVREAYDSFEKNLVDGACKPLEEIMSSYSKLENTASEEALKEFLRTFKIHADELYSLSESIQQHTENTESPLTEFGQQFQDSLLSLTRECIQKRDRLMKELLERKTDDSKQDNGNTSEHVDNTLNNSVNKNSSLS